ncbi:MAG: exosortase system-associated protein, TIGR04073 family [Candidatus Omnitrophica bacterium]|nr:exosortase system-associated protein, TIGR04073 family [Candidatus Omnitrophota bacterium]
MKRIGSVILVMTLVISLASSAYAQTPAVKLNRGLVNALTGLWELPVDVLRTCKQEGAPKGLTVGLVRGLVMGVYRTLVGIYEVVTFPVPAPAGYRPITDPPTLLTSETLEPANPEMRGDFRPLSSAYEGTTRKK